MATFSQFSDFAFLCRLDFFLAFEPHWHWDSPEKGTLILSCHCKLCMSVCMRACTVCYVFVLSLFLGGACKSGKFLAQLVPAVSIPCVHVCLWVRRGLKSHRDAAAAATASGQATAATRRRVTAHHLRFRASENSCRVRWEGGARGGFRIAR